MKLLLTLLMFAVMTPLFSFHGIASAEDIYAPMKEKMLRHPFSLAIIELDLSSTEKERFEKIVKNTNEFKSNIKKLTFTEIAHILKSVEIKSADVEMKKRNEVRYKEYIKALEEKGVSEKIARDTGVLSVFHSLGKDGFGKMEKEEYKNFIEKCKNEKLIESNTKTIAPYKDSKERPN